MLRSTGKTLRKTGNFEPLKEEAYLEIQERVPVWVKSGSNAVLGSDLSQTASRFIWVMLEAYSIKTAVFGTFTIQKRLLLLVGVSGFEPEASWTRTKRDTKLRHTPIAKILY